MILFTLMLKINNDFKKLIFCFLRKDPKKNVTIAVEFVFGIKDYVII